MNELQKFLKEALTGLRLPQKSLPCKYFYDARGSELFESICELEEYYPTRIELSIMKEYAKDESADVRLNFCETLGICLEEGAGTTRTWTAS